MRIYVASSWRNVFQQSVVLALRADGHQVYDFKGSGDGWGEGGDDPGGFSWGEISPTWKEWPENIPEYLAALDHPRAVEGFRRDMDALESADVCVMVMPCGPSASMEMGWAAGAGRFVAVYIPGMREPDLMVKMADLVTNDLQTVLDAIAGFNPRTRQNLEQAAVVEWLSQNGGTNNNFETMLVRTGMEYREMLRARRLPVRSSWPGSTGHQTIEEMREEMADVVLCLMLAANIGGFDLLEAVRWKQKINDRRKWELDALGCLTHVKGSDPRE